MIGVIKNKIWTNEPITCGMSQKRAEIIPMNRIIKAPLIVRRRNPGNHQQPIDAWPKVKIRNDAQINCEVMDEDDYFAPGCSEDIREVGQLYLLDVSF